MTNCEHHLLKASSDLIDLLNDSKDTTEIAKLARFFSEISISVDFLADSFSDCKDSISIKDPVEKALFLANICKQELANKICKESTKLKLKKLELDCISISFITETTVIIEDLSFIPKDIIEERMPRIAGVLKTAIVQRIKDTGRRVPGALLKSEQKIKNIKVRKVENA